MGGGVVQFGSSQRSAQLGLPAIACEGAGDTGVDLVAFLVVLARLGELYGIVVEVGVAANLRRIAQA
ncbi:hypothetical protein D3C81_2295760 [compost metagenome]